MTSVTCQRRKMAYVSLYCCSDDLWADMSFLLHSFLACMYHYCVDHWFTTFVWSQTPQPCKMSSSTPHVMFPNVFFELILNWLFNNIHCTKDGYYYNNLFIQDTVLLELSMFRLCLYFSFLSRKTEDTTTT